jgi:hypothetical protein
VSVGLLFGARILFRVGNRQRKVRLREDSSSRENETPQFIDLVGPVTAFKSAKHDFE